MATRKRVSSRRSQPDSGPVVDAQFQEIPPEPSGSVRSRSDGSRRPPIVASAQSLRPVAVRRQAIAPATGAGRCPFCGAFGDLVEAYPIPGITARMCVRCRAIGRLGAVVLRFMGR